MMIATNVLLVLLGAIVAAVAAFGDTHNPSATRHIHRLNVRGWIIVISVLVALILGVAKEYSADHDQIEQRRLLKDILASREADHQLLASLLQGQSSRSGPPAPSEVGEFENLLRRREQLLQAAERELLGITGASGRGAGPAYRHFQEQIHDLDVQIKAYNKKMATKL
jgi:hypothetical protein